MKEQKIKYYSDLISFTKKFGAKGEKSGFDFWEYNDGELKIFVRDFFRTSSFLIIESKTTNKSIFAIYYQKTNLIKFVNGTEEDLAYVCEKTRELAPIKDLLKLKYYFL